MGLLSSVDACIPRHTGIQSTQDRPASTRQAPTKTGAQARYHDTLTAALQQPTTPAWTGRHCLHNPGNTQNAFAAGGSGWVHG